MDDLINRAMAIEAVENALLAWSSMSSWREAKIVEAVADLPSAQPERKTGKWISLDDFRGKYNEFGYKCSECGEQNDYQDNYCPNCGAEMKGKDGEQHESVES